QAFEHLLNLVPLVNEGYDAHFTQAVGADEGIGFPDFFDEIPHFFGRDAAAAMHIETGMFPALEHAVSAPMRKG
ncbi:hypothetical protein, partial [Limnospira sp. Paracas R14]|uniref:hypothetical protein n=1 Tax=Limnospira sp. Paracas R14 TaxID=2981108 RepID=UPI0028E11985|nr:hypothetical protein [Limnospira sp. Paracas R14]